jgi:hypothetical protein
LLLPRLQADGPKGIDDFKAAHASDFSLQFKALREGAITVPADRSAAALMALLIERHQEDLAKLPRGLLEHRLFEVAVQAQLDKTALESDRERLRRLIMPLLDIKDKSTYRDEVKRRINKRQEERLAIERLEAESQLANKVKSNGGRIILHLPRPALLRYPAHVGEDLGEILAPTQILFVSEDKDPELLELNPVKPRNDGLSIEAQETPFPQYPLSDVNACRLKGLAEYSYIRPMGWDGEQQAWVDRELSLGLCSQFVRSPYFLNQLPSIKQVIPADFPFRLPDGEIIFPEPGYLPKGRLFVLPRSVLVEPCDSLDKARELFEGILEDMLFGNDLSKAVYIARFFTPYFRGIVSFLARSPFWLFEGNRERVGKDFAAVLPQIIYLGCFKEEPPLDGNPQETQKRLVAAAVARCLFYHIANQKLDLLDDGPLEQAITTPRIGGRYLGHNRIVDLLHAIDFSMSINGTPKFSPDLEARMLRILMYWFKDSDPSQRDFKHKHTQLSLLADRGKYLGMMRCFFDAWVRDGMNPGPSIWNTCRELSICVGGAMKTLGFCDAFARTPAATAAVNVEQQAARTIYEKIFAQHRSTPIDRRVLVALVTELCDEVDVVDQALFPDAPGFSRRVGQLMNKYNLRTLGEYTLTVYKPSPGKSTRDHYGITKIGIAASVDKVVPIFPSVSVSQPDKEPSPAARAAAASPLTPTNAWQDIPEGVVPSGGNPRCREQDGRQQIYWPSLAGATVDIVDQKANKIWTFRFAPDGTSPTIEFSNSGEPLPAVPKPASKPKKEKRAYVG